MPELTAERLRELLNYDPETGVFERLTERGGYQAGARVGCVSKAIGYLQIRVDKKLYYAHRLAWLYVNGEWPSKHIDHINGDKLDNRAANLRNVSRSVNMQNLKQAKSHSRSGLLGARPNRRKATARIVVDGLEINLGSYDTAEEAHQAYLAAKRRLHEGCTI